MSSNLLANPNIVINDTTFANKTEVKSYFLLRPLVPTFFTLVPTPIKGYIYIDNQGISFKSDSTEGKGFTKLLKLNRYHWIMPSLDLKWENVESVKRGYDCLIIPRRVKIKMKDGKKYRFDVNYKAGLFKRTFKEYQNSQKE
jgi:hypothetical protein